MRRTTITTAVLMVLLVPVAIVAALAVPVGAADEDEPATTTQQVADEDSPLGDIIPRPNSGRAPDSPNDPGGWQQYMVFGLIVGGMAAIVLLVRRSSKRALTARDG